MLHFYVGIPEALDTFLKELQRQVRFVGGKALADTLDEDRVVRWNTQTWKTKKLILHRNRIPLETQLA